MNPDFEQITRTMQSTWEGCNSQGTLILKDVASALEAAFNAGLDHAAEVCRRRYMGDNTRVDMEARRCADAILAEKDAPQ